MFVAALVIGLLAASEWARRLAIRGMCAASAGDAPDDVADVTTVRSTPRVTRLVRPAPRAPARHGRRTEDADGIVPIPQWQRDP